MTIGKRPRAGLVGMVVVAITAVAFTGPAQASRDGSHVGARHLATQRAIDAAVAAGVPGVTAEARNRKGIWKTASGVGDLDTDAPRRKDDRFRIGNITNTFVATVLLQMEAEGKLSLDDTVDRHLPGLVAGNGNDGGEITVRQLLNHTSGLFDYLADPGFGDTYVLGENFLRNRFETLTPQTRVAAALAHEPLFPPGTRHWFSNTNDVLAALIVEEVGGNSYEDEIHDRIIEPLGLTATSNPGDGSELPQPSSRAYTRIFLTDPERIDDVTEINGSHHWGNGDIISSAHDLNVFYRALMRGQLLPARQLRAMKTTVENPDFPGSSYGLGIERLTTSCGTSLWYHDGGTYGSLTLTAIADHGRHQLTFNYNSDWGAETVLPVLEAEFCGPSHRSG